MSAKDELAFPAGKHNKHAPKGAGVKHDKHAKPEAPKGAEKGSKTA